MRFQFCLCNAVSQGHRRVTYQPLGPPLCEKRVNWGVDMLQRSRTSDADIWLPDYRYLYPSTAGHFLEVQEKFCAVPVMLRLWAHAGLTKVPCKSGDKRTPSMLLTKCSTDDLKSKIFILATGSLRDRVRWCRFPLRYVYTCLDSFWTSIQFYLGLCHQPEETSIYREHVNTIVGTHAGNRLRYV